MECRRVVVGTGEIDLGTAPEFLDRLLGAAGPEDVDVVADLAEVTFIDSTGLAALVIVNNRLLATSHKLVLRNPHHNVRRVLQLTALDTVLSIEDAATVP